MLQMYVGLLPPLASRNIENPSALLRERAVTSDVIAQNCRRKRRLCVGTVDPYRYRRADRAAQLLPCPPENTLSHRTCRQPLEPFPKAISPGHSLLATQGAQQHRALQPCRHCGRRRPAAVASPPS